MAEPDKELYDLSQWGSEMEGADVPIEDVTHTTRPNPEGQAPDVVDHDLPDTDWKGKA